MSTIILSAKSGEEMEGRNPNGTSYVFGEAHHKWKGENATKEAKHMYVKMIKPKCDICQICLGNVCRNKKPFDLINIKDHKYTHDPLDYRWGSRQCHRQFDGFGEKIKQHWKEGSYKNKDNSKFRFTGHKHTEETKLKCKKASKKYWDGRKKKRRESEK